MDVHGAAPQPPQRVEFRTHAIDLAQARLGMSEENLPGRCQLDAARMALEQRHAEFVLELLDLPTERGLGNVKLLGSLPNRSEPCHDCKIAQSCMDHIASGLIRMAMPKRHHS